MAGDDLRTRILKHLHEIRDEEPPKSIGALELGLPLGSDKKVARATKALWKDELIRGIDAFYKGGGCLMEPAITQKGIDIIKPLLTMTQTDKLKAVLRACTPPEIDHSSELVGTVFDTAEECGEMFYYAKDAGYIRGEGTAGYGFAVIGITTMGRAVLSGDSPSPFSASPPVSQTFITHGNSYGPQGNGNVQNVNVTVHLEAIARAIEAADIPEAEKAELKDRVRDLASHPALGNALQAGGVLAQLLGG